jgi:hypothetical protein
MCPNIRCDGMKNFVEELNKAYVITHEVLQYNETSYV